MNVLSSETTFYNMKDSGIKWSYIENEIIFLIENDSFYFWLTSIIWFTFVIYYYQLHK